jgi:CDP-diacylglycerol---glycerol-3-phosphate 3-phosphatidyltransferase
LISDAVKTLARKSVLPLAAGLVRLGVTPNVVSIVGFLLNIGVAVIIATGNQLIAGVLVLVVGLFDMLDGAVARVGGRVTVFGGFLDSTLDRYSEAVIFFGLLALYTGQGQTTEVLLIYAVIVGSIMVSYTRARAEGLSLSCEVGWLARPERVALIGFGLILNQVTIVLWILAIMTNFTAFQRVLHVYRTTRNTPSKDGN